MKKTTISVYDTLDQAKEAMDLLEKNLIPVKQLSIMESHENLRQIVRYQFSGTLSWIGLLTSLVTGVVLGILLGTNVITVSWLHDFADMGWLKGAIAGANVGLIVGGVITFLALIGLSQVRHSNFKAHLMKGRYLLIVKGNRLEAQLAEEIIREHGKQFSVDTI